MQIGAFKTDRTMSKTIVRVNDLSGRFSKSGTAPGIPVTTVRVDLIDG